MQDFEIFLVTLNSSKVSVIIYLHPLYENYIIDMNFKVRGTCIQNVDLVSISLLWF
jgi:hypothetical protein